MPRVPRLASSALALAAAMLVSSNVATQGASTDWPRWRGTAFDGKAVTAGNILAGPLELHIRGSVRSARATRASPSPRGMRSRCSPTGRATSSWPSTRTAGAMNGASQSVQHSRARRIGCSACSTPAIGDGVASGLGPHGTLVAVRLENGSTPVEARPRQGARRLGTALGLHDFTADRRRHGDRAERRRIEQCRHGIRRAHGRNRLAVGLRHSQLHTPCWHPSRGRDAVVVGGSTTSAGCSIRGPGARPGGPSVADGDSRGSSIPCRIGSNPSLLTYGPDESGSSCAPAPLPWWRLVDAATCKLSYATPVTHNGLVFGYCGAFLSCVDAQTGAFKWRSRTPGDGFPIVVDGHLVVMTKDSLISSPSVGRRLHGEGRGKRLYPAGMDAPVVCQRADLRA